MNLVPLERAEPPLVLALDIGPSSVRALVYDCAGRMVAGTGAIEPYALRVQEDGSAEDDPEAALGRIGRCIDAVLLQVGSAGAQVGAVALASMPATLVALDSAGKPLTSLMIYAGSSNTADVRDLRSRLDEQAAHERTGCLFTAEYWPARLNWLRRTNPQVWRRAARLATLGEYLEQHLFGRSRASYSIASSNGLLDRRRLEWDRPLLEALGVIPEQLSPLVDLDEPVSRLTATFAERWPALRASAWFPAVGDGGAANIGCGCIDSSRTALNVDRVGSMRTVTSGTGAVPSGLWLYRLDRHAALLGATTGEGNTLLAWLRQTLRLGTPAAVDQALTALTPDGHGLTVLPCHASESGRSRSGAGATIHGLSLATTPEQILQATIESMAYRFVATGGRLGLQGDGSGCVIARGGALLRSQVWMQIVADALGHPVVASAEPEAPSRGAALLALRALGAISGLERLPAAEGRTYTPDPERHAVYRAARERQRRLREQLQPASQRVGRAATPPTAVLP